MTISSPNTIIFPEKTWQIATPQSQGIAPQRLDQAIDYLRQVCGEHGVSETVFVRNGYVIWQGDNITRRHVIWSCTKSFMSICLGLLWDDGLVTPDKRAADYYPELEADYPDMTLEHLGNFTAGYAGDGSALTPGKPIHALGAAYHYAAQTDLLSAILTRIARRSMKELFAERIAQHIGLTPDQWDWGTVGEIDGIPVQSGAGHGQTGMQIDAINMARVGWLMANDGVWNGKRLLSHRYFAYATVARTSPDTPPHDPTAWYVELPGNYGLNWWTNGPKPNGQLMWPHASARTFAFQGNNNNNCFILPEWQMVFVRNGTDAIIPMGLYDKVLELIDPTKA